MIIFPRQWQARVALCIAGLTIGCAEAIPARRYGVESLDLRGVRALDEESVKACLATEARPRTGFTLGAAEEARGGVPPFDASRLPVSLWAWPWTEWPLYDEAIFGRDLDRIERFYKARGYYDAQVTQVRRDKDEEDREIDLTVYVHEGEPVLLGEVGVTGLATLAPELRDAVRGAVALEVGARFDEADYDAAKRELLRALRDASYAKATVAGEARIDPERRRAAVRFDVVAGPPCRFGRVRVSGQGNLSPRMVWGAAGIAEGAAFSVEALLDARQAIYALGPFASVKLVEQPRPDEPIVDIEIRVVPGRRLRLGFGVGMQAGTDAAQSGGDGTGDSFRQWDLHLLAKAEHRNFLGGMRRLRVEDRPRLIFDEPFPSAPSPRLGNLLVVELRQPGFAEPRTSLVSTARWDHGPDPFGGGFVRSDVVAGVGPERAFLREKLRLQSTLNVNLFVPADDGAGGTLPQAPYPAYTVTYLQHGASLDLRDAPRQPTRGSYFALVFQHAGYFLPSDWDYLRFTPEARGYLPLPLGVVLAARVRLGFMEITRSDISAPRASDPRGTLARLRELGPLRHRLRGGGHNSVRGYQPNTLGDVVRVGDRLDSGGARQWETSVELRVPITSTFGAVVFADAGDVTREKELRLRYPQTTLGVGLRYHTLVGPLRLDLGLAPRSLQTIGADQRLRQSFDADGNLVGAFPESRIFGASGAIHFTIGEAF